MDRSDNPLMDTKDTRILSNVDRLAVLMERDIRYRRLVAGDKYMTALQAGKMLNVSTAIADRAMQLLCKQQMLLRRRSRGTFIGPHFKMPRDTTIHTLHVIFPDASRSHVEDMLALNPFVMGLRSQFSDISVQLSFPPNDDTLAYVSQFIDSSASMVNVAGFVPVSCPSDVYRRVADSGAPTVVFGTPYSDQQDIPSVDVDDCTSGRLLAEHLIGRGHRRIALFTLIDGRPGDNCFYDGISKVLTDFSLPHNSLVPRMVHRNLSAVAGELNRLLALEDAPTAIIVRSSAMARRVATAFEQLEVLSDQRWEIVCQAEWTETTEEHKALPFTHTRSQVSIKNMALRIIAMLEQLMAGEAGRALEEPHVVFPVELCSVD